MPPKRQKTAGSPPPRPTSRGAMPVSTPNSDTSPKSKIVWDNAKPTFTKQVSSNQSFPAVKEMQKAILEFAAVASSTDITQFPGNSTGKEEGNQTYNVNVKDPNGYATDLPETHKEYLGGSDPFGSFLVNTYLGKSDPVGKQYVTTDVAGNSNRDKASISDVNLRGIIETIKHIGTPGSEKEADGIWQTRTNNALKNIYALGHAMFGFANDLKVTLQGYTESQLEDFKNFIPAKYTDLPKDKIAQTAADITQHLHALTEAFKSFQQTVLENKGFRSLIDQKKPFASYPKNNQKDSISLLSDKEKQVYTPNTFTAIPNLKLQNIDVTLHDLSTKEAFNDLMKRMGKDPNNVEQVKATLKQIQAKLNGEKVEAEGPGY